MIETISQIPIEDLTHRTAIVDATGNLLAELNRVRAGLKGRMRDLLSGEMEADFASQSKLLDQSASGALDTAQSPEQVDTALTRTMLQLEELESRFAEYDSLLAKLSEKRESLYAAFETKRQQLVETRAGGPTPLHRPPIESSKELPNEQSVSTHPKNFDRIWPPTHGRQSASHRRPAARSRRFGAYGGPPRQTQNDRR